MPRVARVLVLSAALVLTMLASPATAAPDDTSRPSAREQAARRVVTYSVTTRGRVTASMAVVRRQARETYDDPRGWRAGGVELRRVRRGGDFTLVLASAGAVPSFSPSCS